MNKIPRDKEQFLDWFEEVIKQDRATHSNQLQEIYNTLNGYSRFWRFMKSTSGAIISVAAMIGIIGSLISIPIKIQNNFDLLNQKLQNFMDITKTNQDSTSKIIEIQSQSISKNQQDIANIKGVLQSVGLRSFNGQKL